MQRRSLLLAEGGVGEGIAVLARILADRVGEWRLVRVRVRNEPGLGLGSGLGLGLGEGLRADGVGGWHLLVVGHQRVEEVDVVQVAVVVLEVGGRHVDPFERLLVANPLTDDGTWVVAQDRVEVTHLRIGVRVTVRVGVGVGVRVRVRVGVGVRVRVRVRVRERPPSRTVRYCYLLLLSPPVGPCATATYYY